MEDGTPPAQQLGIERACGGRVPVRLAQTNKKGEFRWEETTISVTVDQCVWRAVLNGYESSELTIDDIQRSNNLPNIVLRPLSEIVPAAAGARWSVAVQSMNAGNWAAAEKDLAAMSKEFPQSAPVWTQLGVALANQQKTDDALRAFELAIQKAPRYVPAYESLARTEMRAESWKAAETVAVAGTRADPKGSSPLLYLDLAEIRRHLGAEGAAEAARKAVAFDKKHELPRAEYVLGLILADADDNISAAEHLRKYLELAPNGPDAAAAGARIRALETAPLDPTLDRSLAAATEVGVPGGLKALAIAARLKGTPSPADFFSEYCRAIAADADERGRGDTEDFADVIETYLATIQELNRLAGMAGSITLSRETPNSDKTARILGLLGWKVRQEGWTYATQNGAVAVQNGVIAVEPGDQPSDAPRQQIAAALGIDEIEMAKSLAGGGSYRFEIPRSQALVLDAPAWSALAGGLPPGGFAELFVRNPRLAGVYVGLTSMGPGAAAAVVSGAGLRAVVNRYADLVRVFGESFTVSGGRAAVPGGQEAEAAWQALAGASPREPKAFFAALLEKDQGRLAAFYFALSRADAAHRRFFTRTNARTEQFYKWYRDSDEIRFRLNLALPGWRRTLFQQLPLDAAGEVRFPGGRAAWTTSADASDESLTGLASIEALVPVAKMEGARKAPLDDASARLLAEHYHSWATLFPYFEKLPGLGRSEFEALAAFERSVAARPPEARNTVLGQWHSLVKLIELGTAAGSLNAAAGARAFRAACQALTAPDFSARALAAFREMAGAAPDLDEFAAAGLLRLSGSRRASFERVKEIQRTPPLSSLSGSSDDRTLAGLAGLVYAALLDPEILLVSEDPMLAAKHAFAGYTPGPRVFLDSRLELSHEAPGARFEGGFMNFEEEAKMLARAKVLAGNLAAAPARTSSGVDAGADGLSFVPAEAVFHANGRLVEIYATITDDRGGYVDDLERADFSLLDDGDPAPIGTFENRSSGVSVALVLDTTGSMTASLPSLRSSALRLIEDLRPVDSVAVYSFNRTLYELQAFTKNKDQAKRAVLHTRASGSTGLHDALARVTREISGRPGKKVIVVFTDGADNASALTADAAIRRAKTEGVAVYTIAQGEAVTKPDLMAQLATVAEATGGLAFTIKYPSEIRGVFEHISQDLLHGYLLVFQPAGDANHEWHSLALKLRGTRIRKVRAREGYYSD